MTDINKMAIDLAKQELSKSMPPKLRYKFRRWLMSLKGDTGVKQMNRTHIRETIKTEMTAKLLQAMDVESLGKNEIMASTYSDGAIKLDFGSDVPEKVKAAAMVWAKKRGLSPIESSLAKSISTTSSVMFVPATRAQNSVCTNKTKWSFE